MKGINGQVIIFELETESHVRVRVRSRVRFDDSFNFSRLKSVTLRTLPRKYSVLVNSVQKVLCNLMHIVLTDNDREVDLYVILQA